MRYIVRKEGLSWIVRGSCGHYCAARRTHADAITHGNRIAGYARRIRIQNDIQRIQAALQRMEESR